MSRANDQLTKQGLLETAQVFEKLRAFICGEPRLAAFGPAARQLEEQARSLASGNTNITPLDPKTTARMPSRELAKKITAIVSELPAVGENFDDETKLALGRLLENLVIGITGAIFSAFPEVIRDAGAR